MDVTTGNISLNDVTLEFSSDEEDSIVSDVEDIDDIEVLSASEYEEDVNENVNPVVVATWERNPPQYGVAQLDFAGPSGTNTDVVLGSDPLYLFELMFTDELVNHIATMTNNYAKHGCP